MTSWKKISVAVGILTLLGSLVAFWSQSLMGMTMMLVAGGGVIAFVHRTLAPYGEITEALERLAAGDLSQPRLTVTAQSELGRTAMAFNQLLTQLRLLQEEAMELANGAIGVQALQDQVLETGQLSVVDLPSGSNQGDLNRSFAELTNQLRRLSVKAHIIANDQLFNPALDEPLPGELGDAFAMMIDNLRTLAARAEQIASGDLTSQVEGDGDLTRVFNEMVTGLRELVEEIVSSAFHVSSSTEEMLHVLRHYERSAQQQADRIWQVQTTVESLFASSDAIADNARQVFQDAEQTCEINRKIAGQIDELHHHSQRLVEILNWIKDIADRSDLLALNAGLEGIRAGKGGRGFTLVANELRRLAENTKASIAQSKELVTDIQVSAEKTAAASREGLVRSEETTATALDIKVVTGTQRENTGEVKHVTEELTEMLNQGVAGMRQVMVAASELASLSKSLRDVVERFEVGSREAITAARDQTVNDPQAVQEIRSS